MKKEEVISQVQSSLGSLFTKDDVIKCINMVVEEQPKVEETKADFKAILNLIKNRIEETIDNFDFNDSDNFDITEFEFDIRYGNQIEVDSYEVDARQQKSNLLDAILETFSELEEEHETRMEIIAEQQEAVEEN
jgi:CHASE3 domain sensor protein